MEIENRPKTDYEAGVEFLTAKIELYKRDLSKTSLDLEPIEYLIALEGWEESTMQLRQLERRHNLKLIK